MAIALAAGERTHGQFWVVYTINSYSYIELHGVVLHGEILPGKRIGRNPHFPPNVFEVNYDC